MFLPPWLKRFLTKAPPGQPAPPAADAAADAKMPDGKCAIELRARPGGVDLIIRDSNVEVGLGAPLKPFEARNLAFTLWRMARRSELAEPL